MIWHLSHRADPDARALADRHYNRQSVGHTQFAPTGSAFVLISADRRAFWITSAPKAEFTKHQWAGAWVNSAFRTEGLGPASDLIRQAIAATLWHYGEPPALGMVTFINRAAVRPTMVRGAPVWGWTYRKAGFVEVGETKRRRHLALQLLPAAMPPPAPARPRLGDPQFDFGAANGEAA